ncbi:MAG: radical SAM protein [archaeon]|nr:radical SAM protein [Nanoarchaeota archaeon]
MTTNNEIKVIKLNDSCYLGIPAKGCQQCIKGEKLVLFITGKCAQACHYCPVSEHKFGNDVIYADEWKIEDTLEGHKQLIEEAKLIDAKGAGITGGDPLCALDRTCRFIKLLKNEFGNQFHIHLYTPLKLVTEKTLTKLHNAGLDEIRFHPDLDDDKDWPRLKLAKGTKENKFDWDIGIEIPCLPDKEQEIKKLIDYSHSIVKFFNLNELELSDTKVEHYKLNSKEYQEIYYAKDEISYGVKGSVELGKKLIEYVKEKGYDKKDLCIYFCTAKLKDQTQLGNRIKRRAKNVAKTVDIITKEGTLIRGVIYLPELKPGFGYQELIKEVQEGKNEKLNKLKLLKLLEEKSAILEKNFPKKQFFIDENKFRIITKKKFVEKNVEKIKGLNLVPAVVEEYPTQDSLELEIEILD